MIRSELRSAGGLAVFLDGADARVALDGADLFGRAGLGIVPGASETGRAGCGSAQPQAGEGRGRGAAAASAAHPPPRVPGIRRALQDAPEVPLPEDWLPRARPEPCRGRDDLGVWEGLRLALPTEAPRVRPSVRAYRDRPLLVFRLEAEAPLTGLATGLFEAPGIAWPWLRPGERARPLPDGACTFGHQYTEFAFLTFAGPEAADFRMLPFRPAVIEPLLLGLPDGRTAMLAPLDGFHEQVIAVPRDPERAAGGIRCGWHGDLDRVPAGFASELALWVGSGPRALLEAWGATLAARGKARRPGRYADDTLGRLSYWTDNGAAYWYRSEDAETVPETLARVASTLRESRVPVHAFELDSWFYPHEIPRAVNDPERRDVPPTGLVRWEARPDVLPEGVAALRERLGGAPLVLHGRHFSSRSPYFERHAAWVDGDRAHPRDGALYHELLGQAAAWGAVTYEQDWLVELFLGVRGLREEAGRARGWQRGLDDAAREHGLSLLWCMATPADFMASVELERVGAIRTSGDYRYLGRNAAQWSRFLYTNVLARALGLWPFKDVFLSNPDGEGWDGDPHAEAEAMLAALSAGPVGIGDRVGRTRRDIVLRTCREDGVLVKPDVPIAALDRCFRRDVYFEPELLLGECWSDHPAGRWTYVAALHAYQGGGRLECGLELAELGAAAPTGPVVAYHWRTGRFERMAPGDGLRFTLDPDDWALVVLCPVLRGDVALFGDVSRYACMGDRRVRHVREADGAVTLDAVGAPRERIAIAGWSAQPLAGIEAGEGERRRALRRAPAPGAPERAPDTWMRDGATGRFEIALHLPDRGWEPVTIRTGSEAAPR